MEIEHKETKNYIGKEVTVIVDRPLGSKHPKHGFVYQVNYGYIPGVFSPDGEEIDAYILGKNEPVKSYKGRVIALIHRLDDDDDKLIVTAENMEFTDGQIEKLVEFQEKWFKHEIIR